MSKHDIVEVKSNFQTPKNAFRQSSKTLNYDLNFVDPNIQIFIFSKYFRLLQWQMRYRFWLCRQIWWILLRLFAIWWKLCQRIDSKRWNRGSFDYLHERFSFGFSIYRNHWSEIHRLFLLKSTHYFFSWTKMWLLTLFGTGFERKNAHIIY